MWQFFKNIIDRLVAGTDRELLRIQDSRKYTITWVGTILITLAYFAFVVIAKFDLNFEQAFKLLQDWGETILILWGLYFGVNALDSKSNKSTTNMETVEYNYKVTNNEDESDPEKMHL